MGCKQMVYIDYMTFVYILPQSLYKKSITISRLHLPLYDLTIKKKITYLNAPVLNNLILYVFLLVHIVVLLLMNESKKSKLLCSIIKLTCYQTKFEKKIIILLK